MSLEIITGAKEAYVYPEDTGSGQIGIIGPGKYVANVGEQFKYKIIDNNNIRIYDGDLFNQGRHGRQTPSSYTDVTINSGTQNLNRNDLIVAKYKRDTTTNIESMQIAVIEGTAAAVATDPAYKTGDIWNGDDEDDFLLYRVKIVGLVITSVEPLFNVLMSMAELQEEQTTLKESLNGYLNLVKGTTLLTNNSTSSSYAARTISIDTKYVRLKIYFALSTDNQYFKCEEVLVGKTCCLENMADCLRRSRGVTFNTGAIVIGAGANQSVAGGAATINNTQCIPYKIVGFTY